jgi:hypothetical protein
MRCASRENRVASQGEMNQEIIVIFPSELSWVPPAKDKHPAGYWFPDPVAVSFEPPAAAKAPGDRAHRPANGPVAGDHVREQQGGSVEPSSTDRAGNTQQQPSAAQQPMPGAQQQPGAREPSTSGQSGRPMPQPQANPAANPNPSANPKSGGGTLPREQGR